ncbi:MAG: hypothetical protein ACXIU7_10975 [Roseinatronobacter sp.]
MNRLKIEELDSAQQAVIDYLYSVTSASNDDVSLREKAAHGFVILIGHDTVRAVYDERNRALLPPPSMKEDFMNGRLKTMMINDFFISVLKRMLIDAEHTPYTKPLILPAREDGAGTEVMPRYKIFLITLDLFTRRIEGVHKEMHFAHIFIIDHIIRRISEHLRHEN